MSVIELTGIKVITEEELDELPRVAPLGKKGTSSAKGVPPGEFVALLRTRARPIAEVAGKVGETETPLVLLIDAGAGTAAFDLFASIVRSVGADSLRFRRLVDALMPLDDIASDAALEQARRNASARAAFMHEFPSVSSSEVADLYGSSARNRAALAQSWLKQGRVFPLPVASGRRFPLFQFGLGGEPKPVIANVLAPLRTAGMDGWQLALWFTGPLASLGNQRPVDLLETEPARVVEAAERVGQVPQ